MQSAQSSPSSSIQHPNGQPFQISETSCGCRHERKRYEFKSESNKGKYKEIKYNYNHEEKYFEVVYQKHYFQEVLSNKKYEALIFCRSYSSIFEDFLYTCSNLINGTKMFKPGSTEFVKVDVFSITVAKNFQIRNYRNEPEIRRVFLKMSPFLYRRNAYLRPKQCQQYFAIAIKQFDPILQKSGEQCPADEEFYNTQRINYLDDMYANQTFIKRFPLRFITYHQAQSLFLGEASIDYKLVKQFYAKIVHRCSFLALRLKKIGFYFKANSPEKDKYFKISLLLYCYDEENCNFQIEVAPESDNDKYHVFQNAQGLSEAFLKHLRESISPTNTEPAFPFVEILPMTSNRQFLGFRIVNELGFCRLLCELNFFIDRIIFRSTTNKLLNEAYIKQPSMQFKIPMGQQQKIKKYSYNYHLQLRSALSFQHKQQRQKHSSLCHETTLSRVTMLRKKTKDSKDNTQSIQFPSTLDQLRGMAYYVNEVVKKWNVSDCWNSLNSFVTGYLNIIVDKNKDKGEKNMFKSVSQWRTVMEGLSALIQSLTKSFNTEDTTIQLDILRTYEDSRKSEQLTKPEISKGEEVMLMTFKYFKITTAGWMEVIPSCMYFFEMYSDQTEIYCLKGQTREKSQKISIRSSREQIERTLKGYIKKTISPWKIELPPLQYGSTTNITTLSI